MNFPNRLAGQGSLERWLNKLLDAMKAARVVSVVGGSVATSNRGTQIAIRKK